MTVPAKTGAAGDIMESVLLKGDIARLTPDERVRYYGEVCRSMGLNPLTKPFEFIILNGKLQLYALRACTDQLRKINGISLEIVSRDIADDVLTVHVRARDNSGRSDEDLGAVSFPPTLKGEARANAELKAVTKAKRRATLSICGLGWLDETEIEDIPAAAKRPAPPLPNVMTNADRLPPPPVSPAAGATPDHPGGDPAPSQQQEAAASGAGTLPYEDKISLADMAREAALRGRPTFKVFYNARNAEEQEQLNAMSDELVGLMGEKSR